MHLNFFATYISLAKTYFFSLWILHLLLLSFPRRKSPGPHTFLDQRTVGEPSSETLLRLGELLLTLNCFSFGGNYYKPSQLRSHGAQNGTQLRQSLRWCYRTSIFKSIKRPQTLTLWSLHWQLHRRYLLWQRGAHLIYNRRQFLSPGSEIYLGNFRHLVSFCRHKHFNWRQWSLH